MAITSSAITGIAKSGITSWLIGSNSTLFYRAIGVGNSTIAANASNTGLLGTETSFKPANVSYFTNTNDSYIAQWNSTWVYGDLTTHIFREIVVVANNSNNTAIGLLRGVYDAVTLGSEDSLAVTAQVSVTEG